MLNKADACIAVSNFTARTLAQLGVSSNKISVSGNGVNLEFVNRFKASEKERWDAVFVGRIAKEKGVFDLLEAWREVRGRREFARLLMIGSGPDLPKVREVIREFGLQDNVIACGQVNDAKMYVLVKSSRVFVFPSRFEGWGLAIAETLACGLPVACYDIPALREVFGGCGSVFLVPLGDQKKLSATILEILEMEKKDYGELVEISKSFARCFAWTEVASKDLQVIGKLSAFDE